MKFSSRSHNIKWVEVDGVSYSILEIKWEESNLEQCPLNIVEEWVVFGSVFWLLRPFKESINLNGRWAIISVFFIFNDWILVGVMRLLILMACLVSSRASLLPVWERWVVVSRSRFLVVDMWILVWERLLFLLLLLLLAEFLLQF